MKKIILLCSFIYLTSLVLAQAPRPKPERKLVLENDKVKVVEYTSQPGGDVCGEGIHKHPPHLTVLLTAAKVQVLLPDGRKLNQNAPAGTTFWSEAETHSVSNMGKTPVKAYIIEYKNKAK